MGLLRFFKRHKATNIAYQDEALAEVAQMFFANIEPLTFGWHLLDAPGLDFSLDSLKQVDGYLLQIRKDPKVKEDWNRTVMRCGAYVGEVVRRAAPDGCFRWVNFESAVSINSQVKGYGYVVGTSAVLYRQPVSLVFPLAKVEKCLEFGEQDNTHFFAGAIVAQANQGML